MATDDVSWYLNREIAPKPTSSGKFATNSPFAHNSLMNDEVKVNASSSSPMMRNYLPTDQSPLKKVEDDTMKSKAVLSALKSLQEKISRLQEENALLKDSLENEKTNKDKQKQEFENELATSKIQYMTEKENLIAEKESISTELRIIKDRLTAAEKEGDNYKSIMSTSEMDKKSYIFQTNTLSDQLKASDDTIARKNEQIREMEISIEKQQVKIEELQVHILKQRRKRERLDSEKKVIERAFKEIVQVHQSVMENKVEVVIKKKAKAKEPKRVLTSPKKIRDKAPPTKGTAGKFGHSPFQGIDK